MGGGHGVHCRQCPVLRSKGVIPEGFLVSTCNKHINTQYDYITIVIFVLFFILISSLITKPS